MDKLRSVFYCKSHERLANVCLYFYINLTLSPNLSHSQPLLIWLQVALAHQYYFLSSPTWGISETTFSLTPTGHHCRHPRLQNEYVPNTVRNQAATKTFHRKGLNSINHSISTSQGINTRLMLLLSSTKPRENQQKHKIFHNYYFNLLDSSTRLDLRLRRNSLPTYYPIKFKEKDRYRNRYNYQTSRKI